MNLQSTLSNPYSIKQPLAGVDWRLLVPISDDSRILVGGNQREAIAGYLRRVGIEAAFALPDSLALEDAPVAIKGDLFDIVAFPLGFSKTDPMELWDPGHIDYLGLYRLLKPGGTLLIGFSNRLGIRRRPLAEGNFVAVPSQVAKSLRQANFQTIQLYGVLTKLKMPRYIFPLSNQTLRFTLINRFRHKVPDILLNGMTRPVILSVLLNLLPSYFVTATRPIG